MGRKKSVYLPINKIEIEIEIEIEKKWTMSIKNWEIVLNQFSIMF